MTRNALSVVSQEEFNVSVLRETLRSVNVVLHEGTNSASFKASDLRDSLRSVYVALHERTNSALTHVFDIDTIMCNVPSHILDESAPTTFPRTVEQHDDTLAIASLTSPDAPSLSAVPAPPHVDENLTAVPPLDNSQYSHPPPSAC